MKTEDQNDIDETVEAVDELRPIAYVRPVRRDQVENPPEGLVGERFYALHDETGRPLALFADREVAMAAARTHDFAPVSAH